MRSPTAAQLWEIWSRHGRTATVVVGLTVAGVILHLTERYARPEAGSAGPAPLVTLLGMLSFLLAFGIFNYTESTGARGRGGFPRRLFILPVSCLRLVAVPMLTGIAAIEMLYLVWMEPLSRDGSASPWFIGSLLAAFMVFYQATLWTLERIGVLRLVLVGATAAILLGVALLPSLPPVPTPSWRSEVALAAMVIALACVVFLVTWNHVGVLRSGGRASAPSLESLLGRAAEALPRRRTAFVSPEAALFWFEWRSSGIVLPALVGSVLIVIVAPLSLTLLGDAGDTLRLVLATLMTPILLAVPVGMAFSKPTFWSDRAPGRPVGASGLGAGLSGEKSAPSMSRPLTVVAVLLSVVAMVLPPRHQTFTRVAVDGRELRMLVRGSGPATVVFENGLGPPLEMWGKVEPAVSRFAKAVTYDRAGVGLSDDGPPPRDGRHIAIELHRALQLAEIPPPYVLVGASLGGPYVRVFAGLYPHDVAGMVLVDPTPDSERIDAVDLPEVEALHDTLAQAKASLIPPDIPVFLIRAVGSPEVPFATRAIRTARLARRSEIAAETLEHEAWIAGVPGGRLIVTEDSGHNVPIEQSGLVVETVRQVVELAANRRKSW